MRKFSPEGTVTGDSPLNVRPLGNPPASEPSSPANVLARLGVLVLIALCFGLAAKLLIGAL
jgi:hypothetical protein